MSTLGRQVARRWASFNYSSCSVDVINSQRTHHWRRLTTTRMMMTTFHWLQQLSTRAYLLTDDVMNVLLMMSAGHRPACTTDHSDMQTRISLSLCVCVCVCVCRRFKKKRNVHSGVRSTKCCETFIVYINFIAVPCGLLVCKNRPALFRDRMSYKATKPWLCLSSLLA